MERMNIQFQDEKHLRALLTGRNIVDQPSVQRALRGVGTSIQLNLQALIGNSRAADDLRQRDYFYWLEMLKRDGLPEKEWLRLQELREKENASTPELFECMVLLGKQADWRRQREGNWQRLGV